MILCKSLAGGVLRIRLRACEGKITVKPGESVQLPEEIADRYMALGLVEKVGAHSQQETPEQPRPPVVRQYRRRMKRAPTPPAEA